MVATARAGGGAGQVLDGVKESEKHIIALEPTVRELSQLEGQAQKNFLMSFHQQQQTWMRMLKHK